MPILIKQLMNQTCCALTQVEGHYLFSLVCTVDVKYECAFYISKVKMPFSFFFERENVAEEK